MLNAFEIILPLVFIIAISLPLVNVFRGKVSGLSAKKRLITHISLFFSMTFGLMLLILIGGPKVFAEEVTITSITGTLAQGLGFLSAALSTGISAMGAGIAVAAAAPAAIGAFSENEKNFGKSLIFVALGEGVAIYGLLISILIINKL
ncbi:MAG: ATPase [Tenericutes bacterium HGW-Tenericutes-2]|jgi:V/A-type H+-transporting ATPase subunit K|nr:MAG: ATPase [Tenericutes bacterium HGW-Tenericutes-2]PKL00856.1 MAG: ATPase [Tenericutes bacterium HGW-Tenericutes-1]